MRKTMLTGIIAVCTILFLISAGFTYGESEQDKKLPADSSAAVEEEVVESADSLESEAAPDERVVAYYFHTTRRCASCKKIEAYSSEAIKTGFESELKNGKLEFYSINTDESENKHFIDDYELYTKSLIITKINGDKETEWKNLTEVWQLLGDKEKFYRYVRGEIQAYLESE